ncbi:MAG: sigma-70 family RNA polymerase sigma factor [Gaiellales bacterium]
MGELAHRSDGDLVRLARDQGDPSARETLILRHRGLVFAITRRYARRGIPYEDVLQSGLVGLIQAVDRFDETRGVPLGRFAARTIEGEIMHLFRDHSWAVRVPRPLQDLSRRLAVAREELSHRLGRAPDTEELSAFVGEPAGVVAEALSVERAHTAEPLPESGEGSSVERRPAGLISEEVGFRDTETRAELAWAVRHLAPRQRTIIHLRFFEDLTQAEIADRLGLSQMHVSRLLRASLAELRRAMEAAA